MEAIVKYPRTRHLEGSRLQPGDEDLAQVPLAALRSRYVVVEEKLDGANAGLALDAAGRLRLQSRGHALTGGAAERQFDLFKQWAGTHAAALGALVAGGHTLFGEWLYAKHTIFYDRLPHYFLEFDLRDPDGTFWSTARRHTVLAGTPVHSVPVLWEGVVEDPSALPALVAESRYKSAGWRDSLQAGARAAGIDPERARQETDASPFGEGLYIKIEEDGRVLERLKWIRASFLTAVLDSGSHWLARPILANQLAPGVDLFAGGVRP
jgi:hypothetical protein